MYKDAYKHVRMVLGKKITAGFCYSFLYYKIFWKSFCIFIDRIFLILEMLSSTMLSTVHFTFALANGNTLNRCFLYYKCELFVKLLESCNLLLSLKQSWLFFVFLSVCQSCYNSLTGLWETGVHESKFIKMKTNWGSYFSVYRVTDAGLSQSNKYQCLICCMIFVD